MNKGLDFDYEPRVRELANLPWAVASIDMDGAERRTEVRRDRELGTHLVADVASSAG